MLSALSVATRAADSPADQLQSVEKAAEESRQQKEKAAKEADALATDIATLRRDSVAAAETAQNHEAALTALEDQIKALNQDEKRKTDELHRRQAARMGLLMALTRLARNPPEALALASPNPIDAERSAMLLGAAVPPLDREAHALNAELDQLAGLRKAIADAEGRHRTERQALTNEQERLAGLIARKSTLQQRAAQNADENARKLTKLVAEASNLKELIERLEAERRRAEAEAAAAAKLAAAKAAADRLAAEKAAAAKAEQMARLDQPPPAPPTEVVAPLPVRPEPGKPGNIRPFAQAKGAMLYPTSGRLLRHFGDDDEAGAISKGLTFETRTGAQVVAPFDGRVLFAGPFKGYGQILIIEHGDGYHSLLAGLDQVEGTAGQWLVAGEPVGTMPGDGKPRLYLELRHDGQPINPLPWLATPSEKVSG